MDIEPPIIAVIVVVILLGGAGAYVVLKDDTPTADRPTWSVGYDWWYDSYSEEFDDDGTWEGWGSSEQIRVDQIETVGSTSAYNVSYKGTNNSRLWLYEKEWSYSSKATLNPISSSSGEEKASYFKCPLEDGASWSRTEENVTVHSRVTYSDGEKVPAGQFETFRITHSFEELDVNLTGYKWKNELYYSDKVKNTIRKQLTYEEYENGTLTYRLLSREELVAYGLSDKDNDGISDGGERWLGSDPKLADTDEDGVMDGEDYTPLFDLQASIELRSFATNDNCETLVEDQLQGENSGCDVYLIMTNSATDYELRTSTTSDQGNFDMQELYEVDIPDDLGGFHFFVEAHDEDGSSADDTIDINEFTGYGMDLRYEVYHNRWTDSPTNEYEAGNEYTTSGNGGGDYDGDLTWFLTDSSVVTI